MLGGRTRRLSSGAAHQEYQRVASLLFRAIKWRTKVRFNVVTPVPKCLLHPRTGRIGRRFRQQLNHIDVHECGALALGADAVVQALRRMLRRAGTAAAAACVEEHGRVRQHFEQPLFDNAHWQTAEAITDHQSQQRRSLSCLIAQ